MGYDGAFQLVEPAMLDRQVRHFNERFESLTATLENPPSWLERTTDTTSESVTYLNGLEEPPAINDSLLSTVIYLHDHMLNSFRGCENLTLWSRYNTVHIHIPDFLEDCSERAAALWRRMTGDDDVYELELDTGTYRFKSDEAGVLTPSERQELQSELRPQLSRTDELYHRLDEEYSGFDAAREMHLIEVIHAICLMAGSGPGYLFYYYSL